jgi:filamentous hemagglutinin family protein
MLGVFQYSIAANVTTVIEHTDGSQVSGTEASGIIVNINAVTSGTQTSLNQYTYFNVPSAGVTLNNSSVAAKMIINEVTSSGSAYRSTLAGPLIVSGGRAHVVLANPNGISVNGGSFVNTSSMVLTTGDILTSQNVTLTRGGSDAYTNDQYFVIKTTQGDILVSSSGLSGTFPRLDMIAKTIAVTGADITSVSAAIGLNAGTSTTILKKDTEIPSPTISQSTEVFHEIVDGGCDTTTTSGTTNCDSITTISGVSGYSVDITGVSNITAGSINVIINDGGAGFRHAGNTLATQEGEFIITTDGIIEIVATNGGYLTSEKDLTLTSGDNAINFTGISTTQAKVSSGEDLTINAGTADIANQGYTLQSQLPTDSTNTLNGSVSITSANLTNESLSDSALGIIYSSSGKVSSGGVTETGAGSSAILKDREKGGVTITTTGNLYNNSARIASNNGITLNVGGDIYNRVLRSSGSNEGIRTETKTTSSRKLKWLFNRKKSTTTTYEYGDLTLPNQAAYIEATRGDIQLNFTGSSGSGDLYNIGGEINANGGMDYILASISIDNAGNDTGSAGASSDSIKITNSSTGDSFTYTVTGTEAINDNGTHNGQELLSAFIDAFNTHKTSNSNFGDVLDIELVQTNSSADSDDAFGIIVGSEQASNYTLSYTDASSGSDTINMTTEVVDGSIYIGSPENSATTANNANSVVNQTVVTGTSTKTRFCVWRCDNTGSSTTQTTGGLISAQNKVAIQLDGASSNTSFLISDLSSSENLTGSSNTIKAGSLPQDGYIINNGGRIVALNDAVENTNNAIDISSTTSSVNVISRALPMRKTITRKQGFLENQYAKILQQDQGGSFVANMGRLNFNNLGEIRLVGGELFAGSSGSGSDIYSGGSKTTMNLLDSDRTIKVSDNPRSFNYVGAASSILSWLFN